MQKHVNLVDLVKSFPTNIFLQNLASIQKRTSPVKFAHLAEKSEKDSISNLSTKVFAAGHVVRPALRDGQRRDLALFGALEDADGLAVVGVPVGDLSVRPGCQQLRLVRVIAYVLKPGLSI